MTGVFLALNSPSGAVDLIEIFRQPSGPTEGDLEVLWADRGLCDAVVRGCPLMEVRDEGKWIRIVVALLRGGALRATIAAYAEEAVLRSAYLRRGLREHGRLGLLADVARNLVARGRLASAPPEAVADLAQLCLDGGRPSLGLAALSAAGLRGTPGLALIEGRCLYALGATEAAALVVHAAPSAPFEIRYFSAWMARRAKGAGGPHDAELYMRWLERLWPSLMLPATEPAPTDLFAGAADWLRHLAPEAAARVALRPAEDAADPEIGATLELPHLAAAAALAPFAELAAARPEGGRLADLAPFDAEALFDSHLGASLDGLMRDKLPPRWLLQAFLSGRGVAFLCPWTGRMRTSTHVVPIDRDLWLYATFFGAERPEERFAILSCGWNYFRKDVLVIPQLGVAFLLGRNSDLHNPVAAISRFCERCAGAAHDLAAYLGETPRVAIATAQQPNIGHHYHNELAGLEIAEAGGLLARDLPVLVGPHDFYNLRSLFALDAAETVARPEELMATTLRRRLGVINPRSIAAPAALADRILAAKGVQRDAPRRAALFMLRSNRRVWVSQIAGVAAAIAMLAREFGMTDFWLDGVTRFGPPNPFLEEWAAKETAIAEEIVRRAREVAPQVLIRSLIGATMDEKLRAHADVVFSVCPKGNGLLPNLTWIANRPALAHGNAQDLGGATWEAKYRADGVLPILMDRDFVLDEIGAGLDHLRPRVPGPEQLAAGYDLAMDGFLAQVRELAVMSLGA